ncbi:uncharacterized protein PHALS_12596 [Plasmopara halstedii]|uniref:Uncharacterized protein n=1 Tax=Plasmopara halstedii TaxID=4781 RepID=A0A0P1AMW0_PLAHL|nr:uncharacterized protein PHALS_12596 [Plasmopara halstedii]CEG42312.1 hypothetical protein PHALS_12596 [Plasmopara halstedii]|eukprot:XP_024578681.1 hypothetical protein PHALS_12596 [Plasmopara halstedii]
MQCSRLLTTMTKSPLAPAPLFSPLAARLTVSIIGLRSVPSTLAAEITPIAMELLNRNARRPKKANHGKRPCSHHRRRQKRLASSD